MNNNTHFRHTKRSLLSALLCCLCMLASAQQPLKNKIDSIIQTKKERADSLYRHVDSLAKEHRVIERIDSVIDKKHAKDNFDLKYIVRSKARWTLKARLNVSGAHLSTSSVDDGIKTTTDMDADLKTTISFAVSYRGFSLGLGVNPVKIFKKSSDMELNFNSYGAKLGFDITFQRANSFKGTAKSGDVEIKLAKGFVRQTMFTVNSYYAFNNKRFSYAAAFSQTFDQKKSAGSFLVGISYMASKTTTEGDKDYNISPMRLYMGHLGVGVGYGYNFVIKDKWLIHVSTLPTLVVINRDNVTIDGNKEKMPYYFPSIINTGHIAAIRYFKNYFAGITAVINTSSIGRSDHLQFVHTKWRTRLVFGIRL